MVSLGLKSNVDDQREKIVSTYARGRREGRHGGDGKGTKRRGGGGLRPQNEGRASTRMNQYEGRWSRHKGGGSRQKGGGSRQKGGGSQSTEGGWKSVKRVWGGDDNRGWGGGGGERLGGLVHLFMKALVIKYVSID